MSRIKVIEPKEAKDRLKEIYKDVEKNRGQIAEALKIQSLRPESIIKHMDLYMEIMFSKSELSRAKREMIAIVVSISNECHYCAEHHSGALLQYWKNEKRVEKLKSNYRIADLSESDQSLCQFAEKLTKTPSINNKVDLTKELRESGFTDSAILDAALVISYFNFVNRMVLSLGVELEEDVGQNYKY